MNIGPQMLVHVYRFKSKYVITGRLVRGAISRTNTTECKNDTTKCKNNEFFHKKWTK